VRSKQPQVAERRREVIFASLIEPNGGRIFQHVPRKIVSFTQFVKFVTKVVDDLEDRGDNYIQSIYWDDTYEIVLALIDTYPHVSVHDVGMNQMKELIVSLPNFGDDPALVNDDLLTIIYREWYEETTPDDERDH